MSTIHLVNIGNTHTEIGIWDGKCIIATERLQTERIINGTWVSEKWDRNTEISWMGASVVPVAQEKFELVFSNHRIIWLSANLKLGVNFDLVDTSTIGADRIANVIAATHTLPLPAIVLDCGSAITTEVIDDSKRLMGGAILPGRKLARLSLLQNTGNLPFIDIGDRRPAAIGNNTETAVMAGIDLGLLGAVERIVQESARQLKMPELKAVAVGGDRRYFAENLNCVRLGPEKFTLSGLALAAQKCI